MVVHNGALVAGRTSNLTLRGSVYWLRVRVPDRLRPIVGKTEVKKSLGTGDLRMAKQTGPHRTRQARCGVDSRCAAAHSASSRQRPA
ncbi:DUF6538 domain-containing protein [Mesorhizobium sp.]|uniref:DUF6538 domain-containing protein n=1 Tax=Mesorhizobium sp. TaxID=1871066 RepID=UPI00338D74BD